MAIADEPSEPNGSGGSSIWGLGGQSPLMETKLSEHFEQVNKKNNVTKLYWSMEPGRFVNHMTGEVLPVLTKKTKTMVSISESVILDSPLTIAKVMQEREVEETVKFNGNTREWYETLVETIQMGANLLHKRHLQPPEILEVSPEVLTILEHTIYYKSAFSLNTLGGLTNEVLPGTRGVYVGDLCNRFKVVRVDEMAANEAELVMLTNRRNLVPLTPEGAKTPVVTVETIPLQRLDTMGICLLDAFMFRTLKTGQ